MTTASSASPATPIFDAVDRWWRDGGGGPAPASMLNFAGARSRPQWTGASPAATSPGPSRELVPRPTD